MLYRPEAGRQDGGSRGARRGHHPTELALFIPFRPLGPDLSGTVRKRGCFFRERLANAQSPIAGNLRLRVREGTRKRKMFDYAFFSAYANEKPRLRVHLRTRKRGLLATGDYACRVKRRAAP